ncbi:MAG TPA: hypothetical protein VLS93_07325, partial [Anaeromyxobacteraceae bacterium]|nr:hypothetical protein [Anaeromyxobacteraceae bacterium]
MNPSAYARFTSTLLGNLSVRSDVLGLVALGSTSGEGAPPDQWSDHDFFVVTAPGAQEAFRADLSWLPDADRIALSFRETAHGLKVVYRGGHLVELAVFDAEELFLARVNRWRVLLDRADVEARMRQVRERTAAETARRDDDVWRAGQLLGGLLVGTGRFRRGERASGQRLVWCNALEHLLVLVARHVLAERPEARDDLDAFRRLESAYPALAREIERARGLDLPEAAAAL